MESAANGHHLSSSCSSSSASPWYGLGSSFHAWSAANYSILDTNGFHCFQVEQPSMAQDLSFQWADTDTDTDTLAIAHPNTLRGKDEFPENPLSKMQFSQANIHCFHHEMAAETPQSFDNMNLEALDSLACPKFTRIFAHDSTQFQIGISGDGFSYVPASLSTPFKVSASTHEAAAEALNNSNTFKKPRLEHRSSCPPLKVRKEKLGNRIAALQQLVSPFGKTDTASVLMEAIRYIKFLQNQVETLSVPYMTKPTRATKHHDTEDQERKRDLRSRGLSLVPLSCLSYIDDGGSAAVWPPAYYGGA